MVLSYSLSRKQTEPLAMPGPEQRQIYLWKQFLGNLLGGRLGWGG